MKQCLWGNCLRAWRNNNYPNVIRQWSLGNDNYQFVVGQNGDNAVDMGHNGHWPQTTLCIMGMEHNKDEV